MRRVVLVAVVMLSTLSPAGVARATVVDCTAPSLLALRAKPGGAGSGTLTTLTGGVACAETESREVVTVVGLDNSGSVLTPGTTDIGAMSADGVLAPDQVVSDLMVVSEVGGPNVTTECIPIAPVAEPSTLLLLGSAFVGLGYVARNQHRRRRAG